MKPRSLVSFLTSKQITRVQVSETLLRIKFPAHNKGWSPHPAAPSFTVLHASWAPGKYRRNSWLPHSCKMQQVHSKVGSAWGDSQVQGPHCAKNLKLREIGDKLVTRPGLQAGVPDSCPMLPMKLPPAAPSCTSCCLLTHPGAKQTES